MKLIDIYIQEVTRRLPDKIRTDIDLELRSTIEDMLPENFGEDDVKEVLNQLGNPVVLANGYKDQPMYLIGPRYFDVYISLIKMILPIAVISFLLALWKLEDVLPNRPAKIDVLSVILSTIGFGGLLYGFSTASSAGWDAFEVWGTIAIGAIGLIWFIVRQFRLEEPLLDYVYTHSLLMQ